VVEYADETGHARALHAFLEVGKDFSNWIKARIEQYGFLENRDYVCSPVLASKNGRGGHIDFVSFSKILESGGRTIWNGRAVNGLLPLAVYHRAGTGGTPVHFAFCPTACRGKGVPPHRYSKRYTFPATGGTGTPK
jgi:hypothetical protein